jgi:3-hydroxyisobutyrate dehydrogenase-like beta-hydroxyacid dehydrogenase
MSRQSLFRRLGDMHSTKSIDRVAIIGFGEAGGILAHDLARQGLHVSVFDILLHSNRHRRAMLSKAQACAVTAAPSLKDCLQKAELVISAVTASSALDVAKKAGPILGEDQLFFDINSVSPGTKRKAAASVERRRARFFEAAVMSPVPKHRLQVPMLIGGPHASEAAERLRRIGMNARPFSEKLGVASAVKMCRSVVIKGLEALVIESLFAARMYGAEDKVIESLAASFPAMGWEDHLPDYLISRVAEHGHRRAVEMREVAQTLKHVGIEPTMALATAQRQEQLVDEMAKRRFAVASAERFSWRSLSDAIVRPGRRSAGGK